MSIKPDGVERLALGAPCERPPELARGMTEGDFMRVPRASFALATVLAARQSMKHQITTLPAIDRMVRLCADDLDDEALSILAADADTAARIHRDALERGSYSRAEYVTWLTDFRHFCLHTIESRKVLP